MPIHELKMKCKSINIYEVGQWLAVVTVINTCHGDEKGLSSGCS